MTTRVTHDPDREVVIVIDREAAAAVRTTLLTASVESERGGRGRGLLRDVAEAIGHALEEDEQ